jgi:uncharacterized damage-inducible protein DinB
MDLVAQFQVLARYNSWMNRRLYDVAGTLSDDERTRDLGAFFGSVHGTLNHLLLADRAWLYRFTRDPAVGASRDANGSVIEIRSLDQILYREFETLRRERGRTDADTERWADALDAVALGKPLTYRSMQQGRRYEQPLWCMVTHFFNHQTHHRGQVTTLLKQLGRDPGVTDLAAMLRGDGDAGATP